MTNLIVLMTVLLSLAAFSRRDLMYKMIFNPYMISEKRQWYRFISSGFIHADFLHLFINMIVLWSFGNAVERDFKAIFQAESTYYFTLLYLGGLVISITPSYKRNQHNAAYNALGASGAVSSVLFAAILLRPLDNVYLYGIIGIPAIIMGILYLGYSYYMDKKGGDFVNHDAHFWGAVFGFLFTILLKPSLALYFIDQITGVFV